MAVLKVIELLSNSTESWEDATRKAVKHAGKTIISRSDLFRHDDPGGG